MAILSFFFFFDRDGHPILTEKTSEAIYLNTIFDGDASNGVVSVNGVYYVIVAYGGGIAGMRRNRQ